MKAVIPAAGLGTRFLPATKSSPKEMLAIVDKPAIQYVVEEAVASGCDDILIITGRGKRAIEDHFDRAVELEQALAEKGDEANLELVRRIARMARIHYVRQQEPRGLGDAILCAKRHIGDEPFAVLLGDDIVVSDSRPCTRQLMDEFDKTSRSVLAIERVGAEAIGAYGVVKPGKRVSERLFVVDDMVEKPMPGHAPSDLAILGRYVLTPEIFTCLERTQPGSSGEVQLTDALQLLRKEQDVYAYAFAGRRFDVGTKLGWLTTNVEMALARDDTREAFTAFLRDALRDRHRGGR